VNKGLNVQLDTLQVISGDGVHRLDVPSNSAEALKEASWSSSILPGPLHHVTIIQHTATAFKHSRMVPVGPNLFFPGNQLHWYSHLN